MADDHMALVAAVVGHVQVAVDASAGVVAAGELVGASVGRAGLEAAARAWVVGHAALAVAGHALVVGPGRVADDAVVVLGHSMRPLGKQRRLHRTTCC